MTNKKTIKEWGEYFDKQFPEIQDVPDHKCEGWNDDDWLAEGTMRFDWSDARQFLIAALEEQKSSLLETVLEVAEHKKNVYWDSRVSEIINDLTDDIIAKLERKEV